MRHWFRLASASISASLSFSRLALDSIIGALGSPKICVVTNVRLAANSMRECLFLFPSHDDADSVVIRCRRADQMDARVADEFEIQV